MHDRRYGSRPWHNKTNQPTINRAAQSIQTKEPSTFSVQVTLTPKTLTTDTAKSFDQRLTKLAMPALLKKNVL